VSTVKSKKLQVGTDATATNNFTIYQPASPDGTLRIGVGNADSPTEVARFDSVPSYSAKAWVNFNGTGTVAIRASGNVSSITDNGTGNYTVNFTTAMVDADYCANITYGNNSGSSLQLRSITRGTTTGQSFFVSADGSATGVDTHENNVAIFR